MVRLSDESRVPIGTPSSVLCGHMESLSGFSSAVLKETGEEAGDETGNGWEAFGLSRAAMHGFSRSGQGVEPNASGQQRRGFLGSFSRVAEGHWAASKHTIATALKAFPLRLVFTTVFPSPLHRENNMAFGCKVSLGCLNFFFSQ